MIVRLRLQSRWGVRRSVYFQLFEPGDFVMMRKIMLSIKRRAEALGKAKRELPRTAMKALAQG